MTRHLAFYLATMLLYTSAAQAQQASEPETGTVRLSDQAEAAPAVTQADSPAESSDIAARLTNLEKWQQRAPTVGGFLQLRYERYNETGFDKNDQHRFSMPNARLNFTDRNGLDMLTGRLHYRFELDFGRGAFDIKDLYADMEFHNLLSLRAGQFKVPYSFATLMSDNRTQFAETPLARINSFGRDVGAMLHGSDMLLDDVVGISYSVGAFAGDGANVLNNTNGAYLYAGRVLLHVLGTTDTDEADLITCPYWLNFNQQCSDGRAPALSVGGSGAINPKNAYGQDYELDRKDLRWAVEAHFDAYGLTMHAEWLQGRMDKGATAGVLHRRAYYAALGYNPIWLPWLEPVLRHEWHDYDQDKTATELEFQARRKTTAGLNLYLAGHNAKIQMDYVLIDVTEGKYTQSVDAGGNPVGPLYGDRVYLQLQAGF